MDFRVSTAGDVVREGLRYAEDGGLETAVWLSLFLDRRAAADDPLPPGSDPRGAWSDSLATTPDPQGSRLWLLERAMLTEETATRARGYVLEALAWLVADGVVAAVDCVPEILDAHTLKLTVEISRAARGEVERFAYVWDLVDQVIRRAA